MFSNILLWSCSIHGNAGMTSKKCKQIKHKTHRPDKAIYRSLQSQTPVVTGAKFSAKKSSSVSILQTTGKIPKLHRRWWVVRNTGGRLTGQWKMWIPCYTCLVQQSRLITGCGGPWVGIWYIWAIWCKKKQPSVAAPRQPWGRHNWPSSSHLMLQNAILCWAKNAQIPF